MKYMRRNISIVFLALLTLGAISANAQRGYGNTDTMHDTTTVGATNIPAFSKTDMEQGRYYGDKDQKKPGTPGTWVLRNAGTRSAEWYNPALRPVSSVRNDIRASTTEKMKEAENRAKMLHASTTEMRKEVEDRARALRASTTEARANIKDMAQKKRLEAAQRQANMIAERLTAAADRVQKLSDRTSTALDTLSARGLDVTASRAHLADAKIKLDAARAKIAGVKTALDAALTSQNPKEGLKAADALAKDASKTIQDAHGDVAKAISSIKPGQNKPRPVTTTPTTSTTTTTTTGTTSATTTQ